MMRQNYFTAIGSRMINMGMPKKIDANQNAIVKAFRNMGISVLILSNVGKGCPDICLGFGGNCYLIEIKNGGLSPSATKLTSAEQKFFDEWKGNVSIIRS